MNALDSVWMMVCIVMVLTMQAGFLCFEAGMVRRKNGIHIALLAIVWL
ncbi:MAG: hypothetical protein K0U93_19845 [Gammaproteobacteria bacterium]|nr:hypothetical protein [Gammaproteobacteria bacterium]